MNASTSSHVTHLDLRGLKCPAPVVSASKAVKKLEGRTAVLHILADDDGFAADLEVWCRATRAELLTIERSEEGIFDATIRVNGHPDDKITARLPTPTARSSRPALATPAGGTSTDDATPAVERTSFDFRGKRCPEPIILLAKEVRQLGESAEFEVLADDDSFPMDIRSWCRSANATLLVLDEHSGSYRA